MKKYLKVLLTLALTVSCMTVVLACENNDESNKHQQNIPEETTPKETRQLETPKNFMLYADSIGDCTYVRWDPVDGVRTYVVKIDNETYVADFTSFSFQNIDEWVYCSFGLLNLSLAEGTHEISVKATGRTVDDIIYTDSEYSETIYYTAGRFDGEYRPYSIFFNERLYYFGWQVHNESREYTAKELYFAIARQGIILMLQPVFPYSNFDDLTTLKLILNWTGNEDITSVDQLWNIYLERLIENDEKIKKEMKDFISAVTTLKVRLRLDTITNSATYMAPITSTFMINDNNIMTIKDSELFGATNGTIQYSYDRIVLEGTLYGAKYIEIYERQPVGYSMMVGMPVNTIVTVN